ncbi:ribonuclease Z, partial [Tubulinosema ratisbonensis]
MKFHIQYLSTRSGKSLLLFFDKHRYVFNLFEGFQRYSIESNTKLSSVTAFFLSTRYQIPALLGTYLTLNECKNTFNDSIKVVCSSKWFDSINLANFANKRKLKMDLCTLYEDTLIKVRVIEVNEECSFVIELPTIRGKMLIDKIPKNFP